MLIIEESIIADETPSAFIRQISLKKVMVDAQLSRLSSVFDSCFLCLIVVPRRKAGHFRNNGVTSRNNYVGSESDHEVFYFWYGILEVFEIL